MGQEALVSGDTTVILKKIGDVDIKSRVTSSDDTWGIPVDVGTSHQSYVNLVAMHLFAAAPLIEMDDHGNVNYVGDAKVHQIAKGCIKYANILYDELQKYKK